MSNFSSAPFDQPEAGDRAGGGGGTGSAESFVAKAWDQVCKVGCLQSPAWMTELQTGGRFAYAMGFELTINGKTIFLNAPSDVTVARRVAGHLQRRIDEDDWRPYKSKAEAVSVWSKLGGIRMQVMDALGLI